MKPIIKYKMPSITPSDRYQQQLFSSLDDQIEKNSIARIIDILIDKLYETVEDKPTRKSEVGRPDYPKESLLKLFIYGYIHRIKSSRLLERECKNNLEVLWLMGRMRPDHWTISNFRKENREEIQRVIKQFVKFLKDTGYIEGRAVVIDGTKLKANASLSDPMTFDEIKERIEDVEDKIAYYLEVFNKSDEEDELVRRLQEENEKLREQLKILQRGKRTKKGKKKKKKICYIKGDPESSVMKTRDGLKAAYNVQMSLDEKNKLIVATDVSGDVNDFGQLENMYEKTREMMDEKPEELIADAGFFSLDSIEKIEKEGVNLYVSEAPEQAKGEFSYDGQNDQYTCKNNKKLNFSHNGFNKGRKVKYYICKECEGCPFRAECKSPKNKSNERVKLRYINQKYRDNFRMRMRKEESLQRLRNRKTIVEHPFGIIKMWLGKNPLLLRGIKKVKTEISMVSLSYNILRVFNISGYEELLSRIENYNWKTA